MNSIRSISIAGAGNIATILGQAFASKGIRVDYIWSRSSAKAIELAQLTGSRFTDDPLDMKKSDLIIAAVPDDALYTVLPELAQIGPVVSTSGTFNALEITHHFPVGVFYPLQSFSKQRSVNLSEVPFFIESSDPAFTAQLMELARLLSTTVCELPWDKRMKLHLAAVFANNFTNHLFDLSAGILEREGLSFDWLKPLIHETVNKLDTHHPGDAQTGPARRNDRQTIAQHLAMLSEEEASIYRILSEGIRKKYNPNT